MMLHARKDYNRFQDPENKIGADEPVMLFRAQDKHFIGVLSDYAKRVASDADADPAILKALYRHIHRASAWQLANKPKRPDMPDDAVV